MGRGSRGESGNMCWSLVANRCHSGNCRGDFIAECNLDPFELEFWKDFWTRDSPLQALTFAQIKIFKTQFSSQP